jgi:DNA polymerase I-like protein with 3'-5' exonuclease and polymerase domains
MIYGQFHQLRGEGGGTRSGRYSSSTPNLQNIPSNDPELAPLIRGIFVPDFGHIAWRKYDYSQIEYRFLIHFAIGRAGEEIRAYFMANPDTDYHVYAQELVFEKTGIRIERKPIKKINFGLIYGMGVKVLAAELGMPVKQAKALMASYFDGVPFAKPTMEDAMQTAQDTGLMTTILNRKSRFDLWEPAKWGTGAIALPYQQALNNYGGKIQRAQTHKALNRRLQGSAADLMKVAMLRCFEDGIFDETGVPRLTVHDELDFSDPGGKQKAFDEMQHVMETAIPLNVPVKADGDIGPDWGHVSPIADLTPEEIKLYGIS